MLCNESEFNERLCQSFSESAMQLLAFYLGGTGITSEHTRQFHQEYGATVFECELDTSNVIILADIREMTSVEKVVVMLREKRGRREEALWTHFRRGDGVHSPRGAN